MTWKALRSVVSWRNRHRRRASSWERADGEPGKRRPSQKTVAASAACAVLLTVASGWIANGFNQQWGERGNLAELGRRIESLPETFGPWQMVSSRPMSATVGSQLHCQGYINRSYRHQSTGEVVHVALLIGPAGPVAAHIPEICYSSRDYELLGPRSHMMCRPDVKPQERFWRVAFRSQKPEASQLQVCYGWSSGGCWQAPDSPRLALGMEPRLFKLQVATAYSQEQAAKDDTCQAFLRDFLPLVDERILDDIVKLSNT